LHVIQVLVLIAQIERKEKTKVSKLTLNEKHHGRTKYRPRFEKIMKKYIPWWMHIPPTAHSPYSVYQDDVLPVDGIAILKQYN